MLLFTSGRHDVCTDMHGMHASRLLGEREEEEKNEEANVHFIKGTAGLFYSL